MPAWVRFVVVPALAAAVMLAGAWFVIGRLGPAHRYGQIALGAAFFVVASVVAGRIGKARGELRWPLRATVWTTVVVVLAGFWWTSLRDTVVDEQIAVAAPAAAAPAPREEPSAPRAAAAPRPPPRPAPTNRLLSSGSFAGLDGHGGGGTAQAIDLAEGGRVVTFSDFDVDPGPDILVYLTPDQGTTGGDIIDLGRLKGTKGDQQYAIPDDVDLARYDTVLLWCRAFSVRIAGADLTRAPA